MSPKKIAYLGIALVAALGIAMLAFRPHIIKTRSPVVEASQQKTSTAPIARSPDSTKVKGLRSDPEKLAETAEPNWLAKAAELKAMSYSPERNQLLVDLISEWASVAPKDCLLFCESLSASDPVKKRVCSIALLGWLACDSAAAEQYAIDRINNSHDYASYFVKPMTGWFLENRSSGVALLRAFMLKLPQEEQVYVQVLEPIANLLRIDPDQAAQLSSISPFPSHRQVFDAALTAILSARGGIGYLDQVINQPIGANALRGPIVSQYIRDPDSISQWLVSHGNESILDSARVAVVKQDIWKRPDRAILTAMSISEDSAKRKAVEDAFVLWLRADPEKARQWATEAHVPSDWLSAALEGRAELPPQASQ